MPEFYQTLYKGKEALDLDKSIPQEVKDTIKQVNTDQIKI